MFREVRAYEIEVLRLGGADGLRSIERLSSVDRKSVRCYVGAAVDAGLVRGSGEEQPNDVLMATASEAVRPHLPDGHGAVGAALVATPRPAEGMGSHRGPHRGQGPQTAGTARGWSFPRGNRYALEVGRSGHLPLALARARDVTVC